MFGSSRELWEACGAASTVLIDISIGLTDSPDQRECDFEARRALGPRRSSVFTPPSRAALEARSYREASTLNFRETGRKLNLQTWNRFARWTSSSAATAMHGRGYVKSTPRSASGAWPAAGR